MKQRQGMTVEWSAQSIRRPVGKKREFKVIFGLMFVSFGFYTLWYHWVTHRELCDFLGRPAREWPIWVTYVMLLGVALGIGGAIVMLRLGGSRVGGTGTESVLAGLLAMVLIAMGVVYLVYVRRQFRVICEAKERLGLPSRWGLVGSSCSRGCSVIGRCMRNTWRSGGMWSICGTRSIRGPGEWFLKETACRMRWPMVDDGAPDRSGTGLCEGGSMS